MLDITINNASTPGEWKRATVAPIYKGGDRSVVANYTPIILTSVVCQQMEHVVAGYLRQVWDRSEWLYKGQHGFRPGCSCKSQTVRDSQDFSDSLGKRARIDVIIIDFSKPFHLVHHDRQITKIAAS
jgi:hypothetical protein